LKLLRRNECLCPTLAGGLLLLLLLGVATALLLSQVHGFLSSSHPLGREVLVIEGWLGDAELVDAVARQKAGSYSFVVTTGGPIGQGGFLTEYKSYAQLSQASLLKIGLNVPVFAVPSPEVRKDRTYASALALKQWLAGHYPEVRSFDLMSSGPHARRSHMLYQKAFGDAFSIGIIALPPTAYDASRWWVSSAGVRTVIGESIAWLYAAIFFSPLADSED